MAEKSQNINEINVRKPSFWVYFMPAVILRPLIKFWWNHHIDKSETKHIKGPFIAIANHCSTLDIVCSIHSMLPKRCNIVTSKDLFTWPALKKGIKAFGCIPKSQCAIDITSLKTMKRAVEQDRNIILYPEGKTTMDGRNLYYVSPSIAKLVKFLDVQVVGIKTYGGYLTKPRFFHGFRRARIETKTSVLMTQEEVRSLSVKQIYEKITEHLKFNDNIWQREHHVKIHSKRIAENLDYILYKCPKCGAEYSMSSDDHYLYCSECGNKVEFTEDGYLLPIGDDSKSIDRIDLWFDYERDSALEEIKKPDFYIGKQVELQIENQSTAVFEKRGEGELFIDKANDIIGYRGMLDGENTEIKQDLKTLSTLITKNEEGIDLIVNDNIYRFLFTEHKWSSKYGLLVEMNFAFINGMVK